MNRPVIAALVVLLAVPAVALAAAKPGSYSGVSSGKYIQMGEETAPTDKGKVTFSVKSNKVSSFKVRGQRFQCGTAAEVPITVKSIKLNSKGKGSATYKDPIMGDFKIKITVTSTGKGSGSVVGQGLCLSDFPVKFTAKRK